MGPLNMSGLSQGSSWGLVGTEPEPLEERTNVTLSAHRTGVSTDKQLSGLTTCSRELGNL